MVWEPLPAERVERLLEESGALARGHFRLSSGRHSPAYVQCALLLEDPRRAERVGRALGRLLASLRPDSVLAPAMGGLLVGHEVARALGVPFRFVERRPDGEGFALRRGFRLEPGERVVLVEDVVTTGRSSLEAAEVATEAGAQVLAVGSIIDRTGDARPFGDLPHFALLDLDLPTYAPEECPACREGRPIERPGSRPDAGASG